VVDQTNGRIFKITYGQPKPWHGDLAKLSDLELAKLQTHKNDWFVQHARRLLQERAAAGKIDPKAVQELWLTLKLENDTPLRLRGLWALHAVGALSDSDQVAALKDSDAHVRAWGLTLALEQRKPSYDVLQACVKIAEDEQSPIVRLALTGALPRFTPHEQTILATRLCLRAEDAADHYLPLMEWYAIEKLVPGNREMAVKILTHSTTPTVRQFLTRRLFGMPMETKERNANLDRILDWLASQQDDQLQLEVLRGLREAFAGQLFNEPPSAWQRWSDLARELRLDHRLHDQLLALSSVFNDQHLREWMYNIVGAPSIPAELRRHALHALMIRPDDRLRQVLLALLSDPDVRGDAIRGLSAFAGPDTPSAVIVAYARLSDSEKSDAIQTLVSRPSYAAALLDAVEKGTVPRKDISPAAARQILSLKDAKLAERLAKVWGTIRPASKQRAELTAKYKVILNADELKKADREQGKAVFAKTCATCHKLFGDGASIGPELTGSQRGNLDYILENVLDPSAVVAKEYQVIVFELKNGRVLNGIVAAETERAVTVQTQNEKVVVAKDDIESRTQTNVSMMPEGLFDALSPQEVRNLVAYLMSSGQK
jgi:putative heme-binding domain-containing protein